MAEENKMMTGAATLLRYALAKTTPGTWYTIDAPWGDGTSVNARTDDPHGGLFVATTDPSFGTYEDEDDKSFLQSNPIDDADFIALAHNALPDLLALVAALTAERDAARAELAGLRDEFGLPPLVDMDTLEDLPILDPDQLTPADPSDLLDYNALAAQRTADLLARHNEEHTP